MNKVHNINESRPNFNAERETGTKVYTHIPKDEKRERANFRAVLDETVKKEYERLKR